MRYSLSLRTYITKIAWSCVCKQKCEPGEELQQPNGLGEPIVNRMNCSSDCITKLPLNTTFPPQNSENTPGFFRAPFPSCFGLTTRNSFQSRRVPAELCLPKGRAVRTAAIPRAALCPWLKDTAPASQWHCDLGCLPSMLPADCT